MSRAPMRTARPPSMPGRGRDPRMISRRWCRSWNKTLDLSREYAEFFAPYQHVADPLIDAADEGMTAATIRALFADSRASSFRWCAPFASNRGVPSRAAPPNRPARRGRGRGDGGGWPSPQFQFIGVAERIGYHLDAAGSTRRHHPFCTTFSTSDVRITTRVRAAPHRGGAVLDPARGRPCTLRARRRLGARGHAARTRGVSRRA